MEGEMKVENVAEGVVDVTAGDFKVTVCEGGLVLIEFRGESVVLASARKVYKANGDDETHLHISVRPQHLLGPLGIPWFELVEDAVLRFKNGEK